MNSGHHHFRWLQFLPQFRVLSHHHSLNNFTIVLLSVHHHLIFQSLKIVVLHMLQLVRIHFLELSNCVEELC